MHGSFRVQPDLRAARTTPRLRKQKHVTDTADPSVEQYASAAAEASAIVGKHVHRYVKYRLDIDLGVPAAVRSWAWAHAEEMQKGTLRFCEHVQDLSRPLFVQAMQPNLVRCGPCQLSLARALDERLRERGGPNITIDCDLCGKPQRKDKPLYRIVFNVAAVVVRGLACKPCLTRHDYPQ